MAQPSVSRYEIMFSSLTNLLPEEYVSALRRDYYLRLTTVAVIALIAVIVISGVLLLPARFLIDQDASVQSRALAQLANANATQQEQQINQQLATLAQQTQYLTTLSSVPTASAAFQIVLAAPRPGITLNGFSYTAATTGNSGSMLVSGTADTREDLRSYVTALSNIKGVTNADLPIGDYAQASDIKFTITLTGSFLSS